MTSLGLSSAASPSMCPPAERARHISTRQARLRRWCLCSRPAGLAGITFVVVFLHNVVVFLHNVVATDCRSASLTAQRSDQTVALVGGSGSGKSTILRLLYRFYDAHQGRVLVDSQDVRTIDMRSLRQLLGERAPMDQ